MARIESGVGDDPTAVHVIGIGTGAPDHLTGQARAAMRAVDVFLVADKGQDKEELVTVRRQLCADVMTDREYRFATVEDPARGPDAERDSVDYRRVVSDWHKARAQRYAEVISAEPSGTVFGFLVWGDPAFYDSTLRILDDVGRHIPLAVSVVPGISAIQVLASEHGIVLNDIGGPIHVTTGRRLADEWRVDLGTVVVMLDGNLACTKLVDIAPDLDLYWGAYLGMPQQELRYGRLESVIDDVVAARARLRAEHGWIMDIYALVPPRVSG